MIIIELYNIYVLLYNLFEEISKVVVFDVFLLDKKILFIGMGGKSDKFIFIFIILGLFFDI